MVVTLQYVSSLETEKHQNELPLSAGQVCNSSSQLA